MTPLQGYGTSGIFKSFTGFSESMTNGHSGFSFNFAAKSAGSSVENSNVFPTLTPAGFSSLETEKEYLKQLQILNQNFLDWITKHLQDDPHCILSPVFIDYDRHLKALEDQFPNRTTANEKDSGNGSTTNKHGLGSLLPKLVPSTASQTFPLAAIHTDSQPLTHTICPASSSSVTTSVHISANPGFTFGFPPLTSNTSAPPLFKFGTSLPSGSPFASTDNTTPECTSTADEDGEVYKPPEPVVKEIKEEGSVFSTRCKLFYKTDVEWRERGVGNLYIKPLVDNKFQLLIRANTNLGNILLNVLITKEIPIKQQKNNLTLVCVPLPPLPASVSKPSEDDTAAKPVPMLVRVKTEEDAFELLKKFDHYRGVNNSDSTA
ncbi:unnamed protein product [Dicrocoelium dendriticum]|nr:unnamed protein product [Dicrocoelium dendriticum]